MVKRVKLRQLAKFRGDSSNRCGDFSIFRDGGYRHLGSLKFDILTVRRLKRVELRRYARFGRNRSNLCRDIAIFRFFKVEAAVI